jgi:hypothetical protein
MYRAGFNLYLGNPLNQWPPMKCLNWMCDYILADKLTSVGLGQNHEEDYNAVLELLLKARDEYEKRFGEHE